jgi:hypothetical protein
MKKAPSIVHNIISKHRHLHITSLHLARYNGTLPAPSDPFQLKHNNMTTPASSNTRPVPEGFSPHTERNATILLPVQDKPFLNPIQEYNRDLSVAVIRQWAVKRESEAKAKWDQRKARRDKNKGKGKQVEAGKEGQAEVVDAAGELQLQFRKFPPTSRARALGGG